MSQTCTGRAAASADLCDECASPRECRSGLVCAIVSEPRGIRCHAPAEAGSCPIGTVLSRQAIFGGPSTDVCLPYRFCSAGPRTPPVCPPESPFSTDVGDTVPQAVFEDCDGNAVPLHSFCGRGASWLLVMSEWDSISTPFVRSDAEDLFNRYEPEDVGALLVIAQNRDYEAATAADCARIRDELDLPFPVVFDSRGAVTAALGLQPTAESLVLGPGMQVVLSQRYATSEIPRAVSTALGL